MATTVTASTLSVKISESITLNGVSRNGGTTLSVASIKSIANRIVEVTNATNGTELITVSTAPGAGVYDKNSVKYMRITNLDDTNFIIIMFTNGDGAGSGDHNWEVKLEAGKSYVIGDLSSIDDQADIDNFSASAVAKVIAKADTAAVDVELYIAST
jgi:hypothetical protein